MEMENRTLKLWVGRLSSVVGVVGLFAALTLLVTGGDTKTLIVTVGVALLGFGAWFVLVPDEASGIIRGRRVRYGGFSVLITALFIGVLVLLYALATRNEISADFTETQRFTLSSASKQSLAGLETPIHIVGFFSANAVQAQENVTVLLRQYRQATGDLVTFEFIDPDQQPTIAAAYGARYDQMLFARRTDDPPDQAEPIAYSDERQITRAILKLVKAGDFKVYFVTGHGEYSTDDYQAEAGLSTIKQLFDQIISIESDNLSLLAGEIPEDASALIVAGPISQFSQAEVDTLAAYLEGGGRAMILADPPLPPDIQTFLNADDPLAAFLWDTYGVRFREDVIIPSVYLPNAPFDPIAERMNGMHPATQNLQQRPPIFSLARTIELAAPSPSGVALVGLVFSADDDYAETNFDGLLQNPPEVANDSDVDTQGPLTMAAAVQHNIGAENEMRLVLVGDSNFITDNLMGYQGNTLFFAGSIDWLTEYSAEIEVEVVSDLTRLPVAVSSADTARISFLTIFVMPAAVLAIWMVVWWSRRQG